MLKRPTPSVQYVAKLAAHSRICALSSAQRAANTPCAAGRGGGLFGPVFLLGVSSAVQLATRQLAAQQGLKEYFYSGFFLQLPGSLADTADDFTDEPRFNIQIGGKEHSGKKVSSRRSWATPRRSCLARISSAGTASSTG